MIVRELIGLLGFKYDDAAARKFDTQMGHLTRVAGALGVTLAGGALAAGLSRFIDQNTQVADSLDKTSAKLGISVEGLQEYHHAAAISGVNTTTFNMALQRFTRRAAEAAAGTGEAKDAIAELGLNAKTLAQATPEDALMMVAGAMGQVENQSDRVRLSFKLFDSEGVSLINMLQGGEEGLAALREEARDLGGVMDRDLVDASVLYRDQLTRMDAALQGLKNRILSAVLPAATFLVDLVGRASSAFSRLTEGTRLVEFGLGILAASFFALSVAMLAPFLPAIGLAAAILGIIAVATLASEDVFGFMMGTDSLLGRLVSRASELKSSFEEWLSSLHSKNPILNFFYVGLRLVYSMMLAVGKVVEGLVIQVGKLGGLAIAAAQGLATGDFSTFFAGLDDIQESGGQFLNDVFLKPLQNLPDNIGEAGADLLFGPRAFAPASAGVTNTSSVQISAPITVEAAANPEETGEAVRQALQTQINGLDSQVPGRR